MTDRYNPNTRAYCEFCHCWFANNQISRRGHEKGMSHQSNVRKKLEAAHREENERLVNEKGLQADLARIEALAMKSFEEDAKYNPFARDELERVKEAKGLLGASNNANQKPKTTNH